VACLRTLLPSPQLHHTSLHLGATPVRWLDRTSRAVRFHCHSLPLILLANTAVQGSSRRPTLSHRSQQPSKSQVHSDLGGSLDHTHHSILNYTRQGYSCIWRPQRVDTAGEPSSHLFFTAFLPSWSRRALLLVAFTRAHRLRKYSLIFRAESLYRYISSPLEHHAHCCSSDN
jgi:hypothetical protein